MSVAADIKAKIDIVDLIASEIPLKRSGSSYKAPCPFHAEKTPSFIVNPERQTWHCFGACSEGGDVFAWEMKRHGVEFREALQRLADRAGVQLKPRSEEQTRRDEQRQRLLAANDAALHFWRAQLHDPTSGQAAQEYLRARGISEQSAQNFNLGVATAEADALFRHLTARGVQLRDAEAAGLVLNTERGPRDRFRDRLIFPIRNARSETVGFGGRTLIDEPAKYINTPESDLFRKRDLLYGFDLARPAIRELDSVIIVEGYTDVISAHEAETPNTVASMGTALTETQILQVKPLTSDVRLALDPDAAGRAAARRGVDTARAALGSERGVSTNPRDIGTLQNQLANDIRIIALPEGSDPDELIRADPGHWQSLVENARPYLDWLFDHVRSKHDFTSPRGRADFVDELLPAVRTIDNAVIREEYLTRLATWGRVEAQSLRMRYSSPSTAMDAMDDPQQPTPRRPYDRQQTFVVVLALAFESARHALQFEDLELIEDSEDRAILTARIDRADDDWAQGIDADQRIAQLEGDAQRIPPYSDSDAADAMRDAVRRIRRKRDIMALRMQKLGIEEQESRFGVDELARAASELDSHSASDAQTQDYDDALVEAAAAVLQSRDAARSLHRAG